jgi:hypothetical protein
MYDYATLADTFLGSPLDPEHQVEGRRSDGDLVRLDLRTDEFGILSKSGHIVTYFKADPRTHEKGTNLEYFKECVK